ncbi:MAG: sulfatase-like hydrolase/transferase [Actinomycetota bacterium]
MLVLTDDQTLDTLPSDPPAMPWFQAQLEDPSGHWLWFPNAVASTPLCCPSRSTILTGRYDTHTQVRDNTQGPNLDDTNTLPVWLHDAGYRTGLVGKYLNAYPWGRAPFIPPGWDRWFAKQNLNESTSYYDYDVVDQGVSRHYGAIPQNYATDVLAAQAVRFVQQAPTGQPWFLYFSPNAPHLPWIPAPRYAGAFADVTPPIAPLAVLNDVAGKPAYITGLPAKTQADRQAYLQDDRNERAMLLSVDDAFRSLVDAIAARGELDNTVVVFLTDNGYVLGLHRLDGKRFPYTDSIGLPFAIRTPWATAARVPELVANLDLASTIAGLAGVQPGLPQDGVSLVPALHGAPLAPRPGVFLDWGGDLNVPAWRGVRTRGYLYVRNEGGFEELYRTVDTYQRDNLALDPSAGRLLRRARAVFEVLAAGARQ